MTNDDFYVYALYRENGVPFYVGKGRNGRWLSHEKGNSHSKWVGRICRKLVDAIGHVPKAKLAEGLSEDDAFFWESALIRAFGRHPIGPLVNMTDGGEGTSGHVPSPETRIKRSVSIKEANKNPEIRARRSAGVKKAAATPEVRQKLIATSRRNHANPEYSARHRKMTQTMNGLPEIRSKISATLKATLASNPDILVNRTTALRKSMASPEARLVKSVAAHKVWDDPAMKAAQSARIKLSQSDPEVKERIRQGLLKAYAETDARANVGAASRAMWKDPVYRERQSIAKRAAWVKRKARNAAAASHNPTLPEVE